MCARAKQTRRIGWIGLGTMGLPMALRLADKSGCAVYGCDIVPAAMDAFASMGGIPEPDSAALLENSDVVFLSLPGNALVQETLTDAVRRCRRGTVVVDTSSSLPAVIQSCAAQAAARGVELIDCPVSGGAEAAAEGRLSAMCGGSETALARVSPLLACFAARVTHMGSLGSGYAAKLINNLIVAIGRRANTESLHLDAGQIKNDRGRIIVNDKMETSVPGVYAIGDCVFGRAQLAHTASAMGEVAAENIMGIPAAYDEKTNPTCVYMEPEAASVGLTEEQCRAQGIDYKVGKFPMSANGKALILNGGEGLVKIIAGKEYGEILGMHIIGPRATDLICEGALAIGGEMTLDELIATIHSHPTVTETIREAALNAEKRAIHIKN